jgi:hypothetical protein
VQASFGNRKKAGSSTDFNPYFGTDYGICSIIKPQTAFKPELGRTEAALHYIFDKTLSPYFCYIHFLCMIRRLFKATTLFSEKGQKLEMVYSTIYIYFYPRKANLG